MHKAALLNDEIGFIRQHNLPTPVSFFSESNFLEAYSVLREACHASTEFYYALKSCYHPPLIRVIAALGLGVEVLSEMEYDIAIQNGFKRVIVNGMGRSRQFFAKALQNPEACIILDTPQDINHIEALMQQLAGPIRVGIRLDLKAPQYTGNNYVANTHKLGNSFSGDFMQTFLNFCTRNPRVSWDVLHTHFTINELGSDIYEEAIFQLSDCLDALRNSGQPIPLRIDLGGGFEVYSPKEQRAFTTMFRQISQRFALTFPHHTLVLEPGRYLSAYSGFTVGTVLDVKQIDEKYWVIADIGTNTLIPIPNARYRLSYPETTPTGYRIGITDGITSPSNNIVYEVFLKQIPRTGDLICIVNTGAYTDVYSTFWCYPPHIVCFKDRHGHITTYRDTNDIQRLAEILFTTTIQ